MSSYRIIVEETTKIVAENESLKREIEMMKSRMVNVDKFYNVPLTSEMVARLHSVSQSIVQKYVRYGLIPTHPLSSDSKILVRATDALLLDFAKMKRQLKLKAIYEKCSNQAN